MKKSLIFVNIFSLGLGLVALDQLVKWWISKSYPFLISANFGVLFGWVHQPVLKVLVILTGLLVLVWLITKTNFQEFGNQLALALILAGAISNIIDRIIFGYVLDYINIGFWPVFNLADIFIFAGIILYAYKMLWNPKNSKLKL
ncbi:MAG: signal peptidase II [Patescibacteria group bacterium]|nr:signal peptidase II [Patescibacteria group bacterium]